MPNTDIPPDKLEAALAQLEVEKARRLQERVDSGEIVLVQTTVVVGAHDENTEDAVERHLASLPTLTPDGRPIHYDLLVVVTGVPRDPDFGKWMTPQPVSRGSGQPSGEPAGSGEVSTSSPSQLTPTYVKVTVRNGSEDDPGQILEAKYTVEDGAVILKDTDGRFITSRMLLSGEAPATLAKILLRERKPNEFQEPIHYPKLGIA